MKEIITERLVIRPFKEGDALAMFKNWTGDDRVSTFCRWYTHTDVSTTEQFLNYCIGAEYCWAITLKNIDEPIGCIDLVGMDENGVPEIGYALGYDYWGKGIMTETVKAIIADLFEKGYNKVEACHNIDNPASGKVMEKCGMTYCRDGEGIRKFGSDEKVKLKYYEIKR